MFGRAYFSTPCILLIALLLALPRPIESSEKTRLAREPIEKIERIEIKGNRLITDQEIKSLFISSREGELFDYQRILDDLKALLRSPLFSSASIEFQDGVNGKIVVFTVEEQSKPSEVVYEPGGDVKPPKLLFSVRPYYPKSKTKEGNVVLKAIITSEGSISDVVVLKSLDPELDDSAIHALRQWKFEPCKKDDTPVSCSVKVEVAIRPDKHTRRDF